MTNNIIENRQWILVNNNKHQAVEDLATAFKIHKQEINLEALPQGEDYALLKTLYVSVDPYFRLKFNDFHHSPAKENQVQHAGSVLQVVRIGKNFNSSLNLQPGDVVMGYLGWQEYAVVSGTEATQELRKVDPSWAPVSTAVGVLGMPGMTAYFCIEAVCKVKPGETVVVSGAAGAVGSFAGQMAKIMGGYVVGIAGSEAKVKYLKEELGFDDAINYKVANTQELMREELKQKCPKGFIDVYLDNTGGHTTDAVLTMMAEKGRVAIVGQISQYHGDLDEKPEMGPRFLHRLIYSRVTIQGFLVNDYEDRIDEFLKVVTQWIKEKKLKYTETIKEGFENIPQAWVAMFKGENVGKMVVKVAQDL